MQDNHNIQFTELKRNSPIISHPASTHTKASLVHISTLQNYLKLNCTPQVTQFA